MVGTWSGTRPWPTLILPSDIMPRLSMILLSPYSGRARSGPWSKMGLRDGYDKLADRVPYGHLGPARPCKFRLRQLGFVSCLVRVS
jgi:hypothetical protein